MNERLAEALRHKQAVMRMLSRGDSMDEIKATVEYRLLMEEDVPWLLRLAEQK